LGTVHIKLKKNSSFLWFNNVFQQRSHKTGKKTLHFWWFNNVFQQKLHKEAQYSFRHNPLKRIQLLLEAHTAPFKDFKRREASDKISQFWKGKI